MNKKQEQYSLRNLQKLYGKLVSQQPFNFPSTANIPQILNQIGKIIVWGERQKKGLQNGDIFDFICQVKLFDLLLQIFTKCKNVETINSVIGFYNMLLTNITKTQTIMYLLSHPCILSMEMTKFGTMANQLAEYYINFLKGLSRKIDPNTIHIFFNKRYPNFPLIFQTIRFFNHPQNLVRTTCRNIILSVFKFAAMKDYPPEKLVKSIQKQQSQLNTESDIMGQCEILLKKLKSLHEYLTSFPFCIYYIHESNFIKEYWKIIDRILEPQGGQESIYQNQQYEIENLDEVISDHEELLIFIDDLLANNQNVKNSDLNNSTGSLGDMHTVEEIFLSAFANQCLSQLVMSLCSIKKAFLGIKTSLFVFILLLSNIRNELLSQTLTFILFSKYYPKSLTHKLLNPVDSILSYNKQWKFKGFWDGHQDKINLYCSRMFYSSQKTTSKSDVSQNQKKGKTSSNETFSVFGPTANYYDRQVQKIQKVFGLKILKFINPENRPKPGDSIKSVRSFSSIFKNFLFQLPQMNNGHINLNNFDQNPVAANLFLFLESKDDSLIMLTLVLLQKVYNNKSISEKLLTFCKLNIKPVNKDFASIMTIQNILLSCLRLFQVDPPNFRICTYKQAARVFSHFINLYPNFEIQIPQDLIIQAKRGLKIAVSRISPYLYGGKEWQKVIQVYLMIQREKNKFRKNTLKTYGLIPQQLSFQSQQNKSIKKKFTDQLYESIPRNFQQQIGRDIWIFMILKQMLNENVSIFSKYINLEVIPSKQSGNVVSKYEEGKSYDLGTDEFFNVLYKKINQDKYKQAQIILLGGYLVLGVDSQVVYKLPYEETYLIPDKSDPRKLLLQSSQLTLSFSFDNLKTTLSMKQNFIDSKNLLLKCHLSTLIKQIQSIDSKLQQK